MPLFFLGTREWRNRQTRTVQVRVPVMEWGFNSPLAHDETADPLRICGFCLPWLRPWRCRTRVLGLPWPRWCSGCRARPLCVPVGGSPPAFCLWPRQISGRRATCPPASRPRRELRSARRLVVRPGPAGLAASSNRSGLVVSVLPGQAPPPPTGTAARPRLGPTGLVSSFRAHRCRVPQFRMQFPRDSFKL